MIVSNSFVRTYLFRSKVARLHNKSFQCCVSTAKEGFLQKQSTVILEPRTGNPVGAVDAALRPCGKVIYSPAVGISDRFQFHDVITKTLDELGEEGRTLEQALEQILADLKRRGIAVETLNLATDQDKVDAQFNLERQHVNEGGLPQAESWKRLLDDPQKAAWFHNAAEQGNADAQFSLGFMYDNGAGVPKDYAQAAFWYRKAAQLGNASAQYLLGCLYYEGRGVPQDYSQASAWYRQAAEQGNADAQYGLGRLYYEGQGVLQDYEQAAAWHRKAAEQGDAVAQSSLGLMYMEGQGVSQNFAEAYFWLDLAADGKPLVAELAAQFRDEASSRLMPSDLSRAQERARKWFEAHQAKLQ